MSRLRIYVVLALCLFLHLFSGVEARASLAVDSAEQMRDDYIQANLLVVSPASDVYSVFGHSLLQLQCPSKGMDYCFSFETPVDSRNLISFLNGSARGCYRAIPTDEMLEAYREAGRCVSAYPLNLSPTEKLTLWQQVDERIAQGRAWPFRYLHTQCTSMLINLVQSSLEHPIIYATTDGDEESFRDCLLAEAGANSWTAFFWQTIMGPEGDATTPFEHKLTPQRLVTAWQHATVGNTSRHLIEGSGGVLVPPPSSVRTFSVTPVVVLAFLTIIVACLGAMRYYRECPKITNALAIGLVFLYAALSIVFTWLILCSTQDATRWNWYFVAFNPLVLLLALFRKTRKLAMQLLAVAIVLLTLLTLFVPQLDGPHVLLMLPFLIQLTITLHNNYQYNNANLKVKSL